MKDERATPAREKPPAKPEIISPSRDPRRSRSGDVRMRLFVYDGGTHRIYIGRPGRLGILLLGLMIVVLFGSVLVLLLGAVLIGILLGGLLVAAAIIFGLLRGYFHRPR